MSKNIFIKEWLKLKPYDKQVPTDSYYLNIANQLRRTIDKHERCQRLKDYLVYDETKLLSCVLASYFEDIISGTNIWGSFRSAHQRLYGKELPFYNLDEYYEDEINTQDISFLLWYILNVFEFDFDFQSPFTGVVTDAADVLYDVLDEAWEFAPENENLKSFYQLDEKDDDFYKARLFIDKILYHTYLFYPDTWLSLEDKLNNLIEENKHHEHLQMLFSDCKDDNTLSNCTRLLSFKGRDWAAEILPDSNPLKNEFRNMSDKLKGYFFYKDKDDTYIYLEHIATGEKFKMLKKSYEHSAELTKADTILYIGIVQWKNEWWFSGVSFIQHYNEDLVLQQKKSPVNQNIIPLLGDLKDKAESSLQRQVKAFKEYNNGSLIAFLPAKEIVIFHQGFLEYCNDSESVPGITQEEEERRLKRAKEGLESSEFLNSVQEGDTGIIFMNPKRGIEIGMNITTAFPMQENPYSNEEDLAAGNDEAIEESNDSVMLLLTGHEFSTELMQFCAEHCKDKLPFFNTHPGKVYYKDLDFLLRFLKHEEYFPKPYISFLPGD